MYARRKRAIMLPFAFFYKIQYALIRIQYMFIINKPSLFVSVSLQHRTMLVDWRNLLAIVVATISPDVLSLLDRNDPVRFLCFPERHFEKFYMKHRLQIHILCTS
jgi:hypothetical protein